MHKKWKFPTVAALYERRQFSSLENRRRSAKRKRDSAQPQKNRPPLQFKLTHYPRFRTLTVALGRGLEWYDRTTVNEIDRKLAASGYGFQTLIGEVVRSLPFQSRRGEASGLKQVAQK